MKNLFTIAALLFISIVGAQDIVAPPATEEQKNEAVKMAEALDGELGLTSKQEMLFRDKYTEFIARREAVMGSKRTRANKNDLLAQLYIEHGRELNDILTVPQRQKFKEIREQYDPLIVIAEE